MTTEKRIEELKQEIKELNFWLMFEEPFSMPDDEDVEEAKADLDANKKELAELIGDEEAMATAEAIKEEVARLFA